MGPGIEAMGRKARERRAREGASGEVPVAKKQRSSMSVAASSAGAWASDAGEVGVLDGVGGAPARSAGASGPAVRMHTIFLEQYHELAASGLTLPEFIAVKLAEMQADHGIGYTMSALEIFDHQGNDVYTTPKEDRFPLAAHYVC